MRPRDAEGLEVRHRQACSERNNVDEATGGAVLDRERCVLYGMRDALWCLFSMEAGERELSVCSLA
jgi:hypothetical protein